MLLDVVEARHNALWLVGAAGFAWALGGAELTAGLAVSNVGLMALNFLFGARKRLLARLHEGRVVWD